MKQTDIPFHRPHVHTGAKEALLEALINDNSLFAGNYSQLCKKHILEKYGAADLVLTPSCTDALSMASLLLDLKAGDEVIIPSYTFVSVANAFANRGIVVRLADSLPNHPNASADSINVLITAKTKAIIFTAYGGQSEGIVAAKKIANEQGIFLIEDAAHSFDSSYRGKRIGSFGQLAAFSFHESKSIQCGQGGMLLINDGALRERATTIKTHGANKQTMPGEIISEYNWDSLGGEFNLPELSCAFLYGQLLQSVQLKEERKNLWLTYYSKLSQFHTGLFLLPEADHSTTNFSIFYIVVRNKTERNRLIVFLKQYGIGAAFHYTGLHNSTYYQSIGSSASLPGADKFAQQLLRLPLYNGLSLQSVKIICDCVREFYNQPL